MSVLFAGLREDLARAVVPRMIEQDDEVRVVEDDPARVELWRSLGAYVAVGAPDDADLIERAAQNCRTLVLVGDAAQSGPLEESLEGARLARVERVVVCAPEMDESALDTVRASGLQHVVLVEGRGRFLRGGARTPDELAAAIDAADDLGGAPELVLDLREARAWEALGI